MNLKWGYTNTNFESVSDPLRNKMEIIQIHKAVLGRILLNQHIVSLKVLSDIIIL